MVSCSHATEIVIGSVYAYSMLSVVYMLLKLVCEFGCRKIELPQFHWCQAWLIQSKGVQLWWANSLLNPTLNPGVDKQNKNKVFAMLFNSITQLRNTISGASAWGQRTRVVFPSIQVIDHIQGILLVLRGSCTWMLMKGCILGYECWSFSSSFAGWQEYCI